MKLLLDQGLPRSAAALLSASGIEAVHVGDIGLAAADDSVILARAEKEGRVVVTLDADFHRILALSGMKRPSVIRIRIEGLGSEPLCKLVMRVIRRCRREIDAGAMLTVEAHRTRIRMLPLVP
jgi:predicted nuclease of predicted toxin-antitoxin system